MGRESSIRRTGNEESSSSLSKKAANLVLVLSIRKEIVRCHLSLGASPDR